MMRQILVESLALARVAAALGWWITKWSVRTWAVATASRYQILDYGGFGTLALSSSIPVGSGNLRTFEIEGKPSPLDGGESAQFS